MDTDWLKATGDMAQRIRAYGWDATFLGPLADWPTWLTTAVNLVLDSPVPMVLLCGQELLTLHNDAYQVMVKAPPEALGRSFLETWGPIRDIVEPQIRDALAGRPVRIARQAFNFNDGQGGFDRRFFDYSFSPVRDERGRVAAILHAGSEITARERAYEAVRASEAQLKAAIESVPAGVAILDAGGQFVMANDEYRRFLPTGMMPSRDPARAHRWQAWDKEGALLAPDQYPGARALRGEPANEAMELLYTDDDGQKIWTSVATAPILDKAGKVTGAASVILDITERKRTAEALARSERRSAFLLKLSDTLRPLTSADEMQRAACEVLRKHLSADRAFYLDLPAERDVGSVGREVFAEFGSTLARFVDRQPWVVADVSSDARLASQERAHLVDRNIFALLVVPLINDKRLEAILSLVQTKPRVWSEGEIEIVEEAAERLLATIGRARAETALRESELRLKSLIDGIPQLIWRSAPGGHWVWASPQWQEQTGLTIEKSLGRGWLEAIHPDDRDQIAQCWDRAAHTGRLDADARIYTLATDDCRWFQIRATPVRDEAGAVVEWLGTSTDIHDLRTLQARQSVLVAELQHRTRNLITVVKAIASRTLENSRSLDEFAQKFGDRLAALSRVQGLLSNLSAGQRVTFDELLRSELSALTASDERISLVGPGGIELRSATVQTFALALHELTTNALKHGALTSEHGRLSIGWQLVADGDKRRLHVDWRETGVALDRHKARESGGGYGRVLIEQALQYQLGARTTYELGSEGLYCTIEVEVPDPIS